MLKNLLVLLFIARVTIPMGQKAVYENVERYTCYGEWTVLRLEDGKLVQVPTMFTVIEEK